MRMMLKFKVPVEKGNAAFADGTMVSTLKGLLEKLKPEAAYFGPVDGMRSGMIVFDMTDPAQIPEIAEPLFTNLNAAVEYMPVMNAEDLQRGLGAS